MRFPLRAHFVRARFGGADYFISAGSALTPGGCRALAPVTKPDRLPRTFARSDGFSNPRTLHSTGERGDWLVVARGLAWFKAKPVLAAPPPGA